MSMRELCVQIYFWLDSHAELALMAACLWAVGGTLLAWIGKGGRSERSGRAIASAIIGGAVLLLLIELVALVIAHNAFGKGLLDANALLIAAPLLCVVGSVGGVRWVYPLSELATVRTLRDVGLFLLACALGLWLLSGFRGWGVLFLGGIGELALIVFLGLALLRTLYRRAFGKK